MINFPNTPVDQQAFQVGQVVYIWNAAAQSWDAGSLNTGTDFITPNRIIVLNTTSAVSTTTGALQVAGGVGVQGAIWAGNIYSNGVLLGVGGSSVSTLQSVTDLGSTTTNAVNFANVTSATDAYSGAVKVAGGVGIGGDLQVHGRVFSEGGTLLYTPKVTFSTTPPGAPRVGDFWIDSNAGVEYQYIFDGASYFWVQFVGV